MHVKDIARKITEMRSWSTQKTVELDPSKLSTSTSPTSSLSVAKPRTSCTGHVLRILATFHWLREVTPDVFTNNRLSSYIDTGKSTQQLQDLCVCPCTVYMFPDTDYEQPAPARSLTRQTALPHIFPPRTFSRES